MVEAFDLDALDEAGWHRTCHGSRFLGDLCGVSEPMFHTSSDKDEHAYTYDAVGNLTDLAATKYRGMTTALTHRRLVYDAFGRLVRVAAIEGMDETGVALYRYNGLNMRLMWHDDADADSTLESSERFYVMFDERWRPVATFRDADATPKEAFVWHAAGGAGLGGSSYIDSLILRDRDNFTGGTPNPTTSASDGTLEERRYFCQNWRADVVAVTRSDGTPLEYVRYSPYGEPTVYPVADLNMDGVVNSTDSSLWSDLLYSTSNASVYADSDLDFDGLDDWNSGGADGDLFYESYTANTGLSGVGRVSSPGIGNRVGYAGYQWDQTISASHVRYRVYLPDIGRWTRRDPLGYVDGMSLYEHVASQAVASVDPLGLFWPEDSPLKRFPKYEPPSRLAPRSPSDAERLEQGCGIQVNQNDIGNGFGHSWIEIYDPVLARWTAVGYWPSGDKCDKEKGSCGAFGGHGVWKTMYPKSETEGASCRDDNEDQLKGDDDQLGKPGDTLWHVRIFAPYETYVLEQGELDILGRLVKRTVYPILEYGGGKDRDARFASCADIRDCLYKFIPSQPYCWGMNDCRSAVKDALRACGLERWR